MQLCSNAKQRTNQKLQVLQNDISTLRPKSEEENQRHIKVIHRQKTLWQPMVDTTLRVKTCLT